jgi:hypothetical protein
VDGNRATEDKKIPPLQLMLRYVYLVFGSKGSKRELMKSWRSELMMEAEEPCGSHHEEARQEK